MKMKTSVLTEPLLEFGFGQKLPDPHDGLAMFGPFDRDKNSHPAQISYGLIGTGYGIEKFKTFATAWRGPLKSKHAESHPRLWPVFPGFEATFQTKWPTEPTASFELNTGLLLKSANLSDPNRRAGEITDRFIEKIKLMRGNDERIDVIICVIPDIVWDNCRSQSVVRGEGKAISEAERYSRLAQPDLFGEYEPEHYEYSPDFRRQIKARAMDFGIPIQLIRESTLELSEEPAKPGFGKTPISDRAWNLATTIFYKAGGKPWQLAAVRDGVCYIGISYRMTGSKDGSKSACCAAQMFLKNGEGVVFRGEQGVWYSPEEKTFHLKKDAAQKLLHGVLDAYVKLGGKPLKEIFLHCPSTVNAEEYEGFQAACPGGVKLITVRIRRDREIRLFRRGRMPVIRGTFWEIDSKSGLLWGAGFKPSLGTYDGTETPVPLRIEIQHGEAEITQVANDVLSLTKLNYNACRLGDGDPVTIGFSEDVGEILVSNPKAKAQPQFKFYI
jgi:hypothetical protein